MVISRSKHTRKPRVPQASPERPFQPNKINANTTFDFEGKNLTPYGGLFPVATMLEKLKFQELIEEIITVKRRLRAMSFYQFLLSMVLAIYVGFSRLHHLRYVARDPMLTRILKVLTLPVQSTYWRFLDSLAWERGPATVASATEDAGASVGGGPGAAGLHHPGHRHHGAHHLQPEQDGSTQGL